MKLDELLKDITRSNNRIMVENFSEWVAKWLDENELYINEALRNKVKGKKLKAIKAEDLLELDRLRKEKQKMLMNLGVWNFPRAVTVKSMEKTRSMFGYYDGGTLLFDINDDEYKVVVVNKKLKSIEVTTRGFQSISIDEARLIMSALINLKKYLPWFYKEQELFIL